MNRSKNHLHWWVWMINKVIWKRRPSLCLVNRSIFSFVAIVDRGCRHISHELWFTEGTSCRKHFLNIYGDVAPDAEWVLVYMVSRI